MNNKTIFGMVFISVLLVMQSVLVLSEPPQPINVAGRVTNNDSTGVANGMPIIIIDTNTTQEFNTQVFAPPIPQLMGSYSTTITASIGDIIYVYSYNDTHYGDITKVITSTTTFANITLNKTRPTELNLTIISPLNDSIYNTSNIFNVTVNVSALVSTGINCNVTLNIEDEAIIGFNVGANKSNIVGNINVGETKTTYFELIALTVGTTNMNATGVCSNGGSVFMFLNFDAISNIQVEDKSGPIIQLINPENNTENSSTNDIDFKFNVSDESLIDECRLYVNNTLQDSSTSITKDITETLLATLSSGSYEWYINCTDEYSNEGMSEIYYFNITVFSPVITFEGLNQDIILNAGSTKSVECNISIYDGNGALDINPPTAILYSSTTTSDAVDSNNNHYTNSSCENIASSTNSVNYTCSFELEYYALNGTWNCNASTTDMGANYASNETNTSIQTLYAINLSALFIDYGDISTGGISGDESLSVFNIGNQPIDVNVKGFGGDNPIVGNNLAMLCNNGENISVENQRFSTNALDNFAQKLNLSSIDQNLNLAIPKQTIPGSIPESLTYWQLKADTPTSSQCNGTIMFTATST